MKSLYVKFFDVKNGAEALPVATLNFQDKIPTSFQLVPVVYIENDVFKTIAPNVLANKIFYRIEEMLRASGHAQVAEYQIDCDWTTTTKVAYFDFLQKFKNLMPPSAKLSATIRLHQIKYAEKTGVPPVDKGLLMFYNMSDVKNLATENSILDNREARKYMTKKAYSLPLDFALPIFEWSVLFQKNLQNWVQNVILEKKVDNPAFWNLTNAHLFYINKQWSKAQDALNIAENSKGINDDIRRQINITCLLSFALDNGKITPAIEQKISKGIIALQRQELPEARNYNYASSDEYYKDERSALDNILVALANRYEQQDDVVKAGLLLSRSNHLQRSSKKFVHSYGMYSDYFFYFDEFGSSKDLKQVLDLVNKEQKNSFENFLTIKADKEYHRLCDLYGTMLFRESKEADQLRENLEYDSNLSSEDQCNTEKIKPEYTSPFATQLRSNFSEFIDNLLNDCGKLQQEENKVRL